MQVGAAGLIISLVVRFSQHALRRWPSGAGRSSTPSAPAASLEAKSNGGGPSVLCQAHRVGSFWAFARMSIVYVLASNRIEHGVNGRYVEVVG